MTPMTIIQSIVATFKASPYIIADTTLGGLLGTPAGVDPSNIFEGVRDGIVAFPAIVIETAGDRMVEQQMPYEKIIQSFKVGIVVQVYNKDTQLEALLALKNAIKKCVSNNETWGLADVITSVTMSSADDNTNYPLRGSELNVEVTYRQNRLTRA